MIQKPAILEERLKYSQKRIGEFKEEITRIEELKDTSALCIYVTGSYGRSEASQHSDLDLFFVHKGTRKKSELSRVKKALIDASLIKASRRLKFPEFSGGGRFLQVHYLEDIKRTLGSPADDYMNFFTARVLLLLESISVFNDALYDDAAKEIIDAYYRDYHDHEKNFRPVFLVNDIIRYWKTLCLNYEHRRNRPEDNEAKRNESHLKNLKLKFSRVLTCYSTIMVLVKNQQVVTPQEVFELMHRPPLERLNDVASKVEGGDDLLGKVYERYAWFLEVTGRPESETLKWVADQDSRYDAFERARSFGDDIYQLLKLASEKTDIFRYVVI